MMLVNAWVIVSRANSRAFRTTPHFNEACRTESVIRVSFSLSFMDGLEQGDDRGGEENICTPWRLIGEYSAC